MGRGGKTHVVHGCEEAADALICTIPVCLEIRKICRIAKEWVNIRIRGDLNKSQKSNE